MSYGQDNKLNTIKAVRELTGLGLKETKELVEKAPVDFETTSAIDVVERALHGAGAEFTWEEVPVFVRPSTNNDSQSFVRPSTNNNSQTEVQETAAPLNSYMTIFLPSLTSKRTEVIQLLQEIMGFKLWEAEIYVDKSPTQLSFTDKEKGNLLIDKLTELGFQIESTIPPVFYDEVSAKNSYESIKGVENKAKKAIEQIQDAYDSILPLVTLSKLVSELAIKETSLNMETAEKNYRKIVTMSSMAEDLQDKASNVLNEFLPLKEEAINLLVNARPNGAFGSQGFSISFSTVEEMVDKTVALFKDGKNLCENLIKNAVSQIKSHAKKTEAAINNAKELEKKGSDLLEKYSGDAIYEGLTALSEINFALPLPHTVRGTVYRRPKFESQCDPFVGVLVEIDGIVSPDAAKTEADEKPSCYTDSNGDFIIVMPERYSLKETIRIIVSQGSNRQVFMKSAAEFLYSVPEQKLLDQFIEVDNLGRELSNLKMNLSGL